MSETIVSAQPRTATGKGAARRLRREGKIPAILYGGGGANLPLAVGAAVVQRHLAGGTEGQLVQLEIEGEAGPVTALVKEVQIDPVRGEPRHIDFYRVALDREVTTTVPVVLRGEADRPRDGGVISQLVRDLAITCLPNRIPGQLTVDVSGLAIGDTVTVAELELPEGVRLAHGVSSDEPVVQVLAPAKQAAQAAAEEPAAEDAGDAAREDNEGDAGEQ
ncbi:MAG TPA: 50S ribosomal protein L25 [Limnochordia bacterium]